MKEKEEFNDDIQEEEIASDNEYGENTLEEKIKEVREKLKACESQKKEYLDGWQRSKADFINLRKKDEEEKSNFIRFASQDMIQSLIPALESFHMAMESESWKEMSQEWKTGIENIYNQIWSPLSQAGLKEINPGTGEVFDPLKHEAVGFEPVEDKTFDQKITVTVQKGYELNGRTIKPAKIKMGELGN